MNGSYQSSQEAIKAAREELQKHPDPPHDPALAYELLDWLGNQAAESQIEVSIHRYPYGSKLLQDGTWLRAYGNQHPPGTAFLGIVLDKVLEVTVVEDLKDNKFERFYHRPMAMLYPGMLFGLFELADFQCGNLSQQNYTVYAGARTFFFKDPQLGDGCKSFGKTHSPIGRALFQLKKKDDFISLGVNKKMNTNLKADLEKRMKERGYENAQSRYSPTELPFGILKSILDAESDWKASVMLISLGSNLSDVLGPELRQKLFLEAWNQSGHLRRAAVSSYSSDEIAGSIGEVSTAVASGVAREIQALEAVLNDQRPGFQSLPASDSSLFGPFEDFFDSLEKLQTEHRNNQTDYDIKNFVKAKFESCVHLPVFRFDSAAGDIVVPVFPNCHPTYDGDGAREKEAGMTPVKTMGAEWFPTDVEPYIHELLEWNGAVSGDGHKNSVSFLRTYASVSPLPFRLPAFKKVDGDLSRVDGVVAVQHLMEETVCLVSELIMNRKVRADSIWIIGKPYSSNYRVAHRLRSLGIHVSLPVPASDCKSGEFGSWFSGKVEEFFNRAIKKLSPSDEIDARIVLLDDGGNLIQAASKTNLKHIKFAAVEQTSRGLEAAQAGSKKFPVVPVACCALKSIVEPEFVARAAIAKLAKAYPEALRAEKVGVVGLGNIGRYLCEYLTRRPDIKKKCVLAYDKDASRGNDLPINAKRVESFGELLGADGVNVLLCCTGTDLSVDLLECNPSEAVLCISLSSGDVEFSRLLKKTEYKNRYGLVRYENFLIAAGGFPVTFDREPVSAPVFEMQITRALLLAGMIEAAAAMELKGLVRLSHEVQWKIWSQWREEATDINTRNAEILRWQRQRKSENLEDLEMLIPTEVRLQEENARLFEERTSPSKAVANNAKHESSRS